MKHTNLLNLWSQNIKQAVHDDREQKSVNPIEAQEEEEMGDMYYVLDATKYTQTHWEV